MIPSTVRSFPASRISRWRDFLRVGGMLLVLFSPAARGATAPSLPAVVFLEKDLEGITGLQLSRLKQVVGAFLSEHQGARGIPPPESLDGIWIFGYRSRADAEGTFYSRSELKNGLKPGKYFRDVPFVWDFSRLVLGDWSFDVSHKGLVHAAVISPPKDAAGSSNVLLMISIDTTDDYKIVGWKVHDDPVLGH